MVPDDILRAIQPALKQAKACWIKPDGSILPCDLLYHFAALGVEDRYDELLGIAEEQTQRWLETFDQDEHIPWHMVDDDFSARTDLMTELAHEGYIRCGLMLIGKMTSVLEMETTNATAKKHRDIILYVSAALNIDRIYITDPQSFRQSFRRKRYS